MATNQSESNWLIVTDLDGTLLDHEDYSLAPAREAIERVKQKGIPLVFCSSKTAAEIRLLQQQVGISDPFVAENGGAVYLESAADSRTVIEIGVELLVLEKSLGEIEEALDLSLKPITRMSAEEIMEITGLSQEGAQLARQREYSLPFLFENRQVTWDLMEREASSRGLTLTRGGRFAHLMGNNDKGKAVTRLVEHWSGLGHESTRTVGLGDSLNDLSMLEVVTFPIRIPNPGSSAPLTSELDWAIEVNIPGPRGWNAAVGAFLDRFLPG